MKISKRILLTFILFVFINCQDRRITFANHIKQYALSINRPKGTEKFVSGFENKLTLLFYTLTLKELEETKVKFDLSNELINQIKAAPYARSSAAKKINEATVISYYSYEETLGAAIKEDDGRITFALIKTKAFSKLRVMYEPQYEEQCDDYFWGIVKDCHNVLIGYKQRQITESDKELIKQAAKYSAINSILEGVDILKRGDYELYMTDTGSIFSPDRKSVAHITYFGNIAIGPVSELNAILPMEYEYVDRSNLWTYTKPKTNDADKKEVGNFTKMLNYPKGKNKTTTLNIKEGLFHKFNFLTKDKVTKFPLDLIDYMNKTSQRGPFVLEVKKNGNVILYEKKTKRTIWETNTANKGKGPYNFHLTNDKKLTLKDSNGKILYQSGVYKDVPTIYYGGKGKNGRHVYNGRILKESRFNSPLAVNLTIIFRKYIKPYFRSFRSFNGAYSLNVTSLHLMTDNDEKYKIKYGGRIKGTNQYFNFDNNGNYHPEIYKNKANIKIDMFYASFINGNSDYDICYSAFTGRGWSNFACNGVKVGFGGGDESIIYGLIIYVKGKGEALPFQINSFGNLKRDSKNNSPVNLNRTYRLHPR